MLSGTRVKVGAQNMHWADDGAWTGEISPLMLKDCGLDLVELGHSERREHFGETDETVGLKVAAAVRHGLIPLICIGETLEERQGGRASEVLERQVRAALAGAGAAPVLLAYEPVWAIGANGIPATADYADARQAEIIAVAQDVLGRRVPCLYGGSVNPGNCAELIACRMSTASSSAGRPGRSRAIWTSWRAAPQRCEGDDMKLAIAGDSAGEGLAKVLADHLKSAHDVVEISRVDGVADPFYANLSDRVASEVLAGKHDRAILVCGTGIGVCIAANKVPGIRAALCHDTYSATRAALSNNAQIITMGSRVIGRNWPRRWRGVAGRDDEL